MVSSSQFWIPKPENGFITNNLFKKVGVVMNYNAENLLGMVELYAEEMGYTSSEDDLSAKFDEEIVPGLLEQYGEKGVAFNDDPLLNETFSNWKDSLCKEGEIHPEQYDKYCYTGEFA